MKLYLMRHGAPDYTNDCLIEDGRVQALELAEYLDKYDFDVIYSSSMGRAMETAKYTADRHHMEIIPCDWAREDLGGKYFATVRDGRWYWYMWLPEIIKIFESEEVRKLDLKWFEAEGLKDTPLKEGFEVMAKSVDEFMLSLGYEHDRVNHKYNHVSESPKNVALFAHGAFAYSFLSNLLDIPYPIFTRRMKLMELCSVTIIEFPEFDSVMPRIEEYNHTSHLSKIINFRDLK